MGDEVVWYDFQAGRVYRQILEVLRVLQGDFFEDDPLQVFGVDAHVGGVDVDVEVDYEVFAFVAGRVVRFELEGTRKLRADLPVECENFGSDEAVPYDASAE